MLVTVQSKKHSCTCALPEEVRGALWLADAEGQRIAFAEAAEGCWRITPAPGFRLSGTSGAGPDEAILDPDCMTILKIESDAHDGPGEDGWIALCRPGTTGDKTSRIVGFSRDVDITIGRTGDNVLVYPSPFVSGHHARLSFSREHFSILDNDSSNGVFLNGRRLPSRKDTPLSAGDVVSLLGLRLVIGDKFVSFNNPENDLIVHDQPGFVEYRAEGVPSEAEASAKERRHFYPALRFARSIERKSFVVDAPPQREQGDDTPIAMRIGPSLVMAMAAVLSAAVSLTYLTGQGNGFLRAIPMVAMAVAMLAGSVLWPILNKRYQTKKQVQKESQRRGAYSQYLGKIRSELLQEARLQEEILRENRLTAADCMAHAHRADSLFMSRTSLHQDYLELRLGCGEEPLAADIRFPDRHFSAVEDDLLDVVHAFSQEPHVLPDVPLGFSLIEKPVMGIVGSDEDTQTFLRNLVIQIAALHSYGDVKLVLFCDEAQREAWRFVSYLPHCFDNERTMRYFACSLESANEVGMVLERELEARHSSNGFDAREAEPYYVVLCPSKAAYEKTRIVEAILEEKDNRGFSLIATAREMHELPRQCRSIVGLENGGGYLLDRDDPLGRRQPFALDPCVSLHEAEASALDMSKVELDLADAKEQLPERLGFLEMFGVANLEHLNVASRWRANSGAVSLATSVGLDPSGEPFVLNLHEKFHGPHGLIAGTTGSGKSEFIITYLLSLAVNYSPEDVAFVLIDYKGGGLANAFDNDRLRLPHVAGTITNLDGAAISRSLVSIKSELKRRQRLFNETRETVGGDNVDIYRYLDLYRQGKVDEPCPHLIIVADEFAELKQQEPEFMDELISAARIGRSLGVHLVLATQKPSGVVNDQIWSNSRFKICLKVADAADSQELLRRPDAAELTQAGRFYLMVGYNELFALGQSGYSGVPYRPRSAFERSKDESVEFLSDTGRTLLAVKPPLPQAAQGGESELVALLKHVCQVADGQQLSARRLWLDPLPAHLAFKGLVDKYGWNCEDSFELNPVIGELDDPSNQRQGLLVLPLSEGGNTLLYGMPDCGVEAVAQIMLYSLVASHSARTLHAYVLDFGSQAFAAFSNAPQVGDVIFASEEEKVRRFFDFMAKVVERRRALFSKQGGSFARYCAHEGDCPAIVVVINGVTSLLELYPSYEDALLRFVRESSSVGVRVVMTAEASSSVRMRLRNCFRQVLACELADPSDYIMLFGSMRDLPQPKGFGRGLVDTEEGVFEFQAASVGAEGESDYELIAQACARLAEHAIEHAPAVPVAPEQLDPLLLVGLDVPGTTVPYGVFDDTLGAAGFDFAEAPLARCLYQKRKVGTAFAKGFLAATALSNHWRVAMLDMAQLLDEQPAGCALATRKDDFALGFLQRVMEKGVAACSEAGTGAQGARLLLVFTGIMDFINRIGLDAGNALRAYLKTLKPAGEVCVLLLDGSSDGSYAYEDWFKAQLSTKDGLWVGGGVDSQNSIGLSYNARFLPDSSMGTSLGYAIEGGNARLVHIVELPQLEREEEADDREP